MTTSADSVFLREFGRNYVVPVLKSGAAIAAISAGAMATAIGVNLLAQKIFNRHKNGYLNVALSSIAFAAGVKAGFSLSLYTTLFGVSGKAWHFITDRSVDAHEAVMFLAVVYSAIGAGISAVSR